MLVQRNIENAKTGRVGEYAELLKAIPDYGPAPPRRWRVYRAASFAPWDAVVFEIEFESMEERSAWWKSWSHQDATPSQREWYDRRKELVDGGSKAELWRVDSFG